jgi:two-component system KDP operon response regulator KdpE
MARILVIDDDRALLRALRVALQAAGHEVTSATGGGEGLEQAAISAPDVVLLDLGLPDVDGLEVLHRLRQWTEVPIIILSAAGDEARKVAALDQGADDYVTKPFGMAELEARIRVHTRRSTSERDQAPSEIVVGTLVIDTVHHGVHLAGTQVDLTGREFDILAYLARHAGRICTHQMILHQVWGTGYGTEAQYVHVYVHRLRRKLGDESGRLLKTVPGIGYELAVPGVPDAALG